MSLILGGVSLARHVPGASRACRPEEMPVFDFVFIVIGVAAFMATTLYLPACDKL